VSIPPTPLTPELWVAQSDDFLTNSGLFLIEKQAVLVDPGVRPAEIEAIAAFLQAQGAVVRCIVLTHSHWDHVLGPERFPKVRLIAQARYGEAVARQAGGLTDELARWEADLGVKRATPFAVPMPDETFDDNGLLMLSQVTLQLLHVPGHAADQLALYQPERGLLWASDLLSDVEIPIVSDSLTAYESTLARLATLDVRVLVPGHGHPATGRAEINARLAQDRAYLAELHERVARVVASGAPLSEAVRACAEMAYHHRAENAETHRLNVENVFAELGSQPEPQ